MKAKFVYENLSDLFKPKSEEEILQIMKMIPSMYVERLNKGAFAEPSTYPLIVEIYEKALKDGYPVSHLKSNIRYQKGAEFKILARDKEYPNHSILRFIIRFIQYDHRDFIKVHKYDTFNSTNHFHYPNLIYTYEKFKEFIEHIILKEMIPVHSTYDNGKRTLTNFSIS